MSASIGSKSGWFGLALLGLLAAGSAEAQNAALVRRIDSIVAAARSARSVPGVVIGAVRGTDTLVLKGYGVADLENDVPVTPETVFQIASISKQFTAAAILRLAERGKLTLEDELTRFVPDYVTNGRKVTLLNLLTHTHGMQDYNRPEVQGEWALPFSHRRFLELMKDQQFDFPVGERYLYRNSGYYFAAMIVEQLGGREGSSGGGSGPITSRRFGDFLKEELFDRASLTRTSDCRSRPVLPGRAHGYTTQSGTVTNAMIIDWSWAFGVGSLCSTARDLIRWNAALHGGRILSPGSYERMITPARLNDGTQVPYGLGIAIDTAGGRRVFRHGGGAPGFSTHLAYYPDRRLTVVVLTNHDGVDAGAIARDVAAAIFDAER